MIQARLCNPVSGSMKSLVRPAPPELRGSAVMSSTWSMSRSAGRPLRVSIPATRRAQILAPFAPHQTQHRAKRFFRPGRMRSAAYEGIFDVVGVDDVIEACVRNQELAIPE